MKLYCRDCKQTFNVKKGDALPDDHAFYENTDDLVEVYAETTRQNERTYNYPGKLLRSELEKIKLDAKLNDLSPAAYLRQLCRLDPVTMGAPKGNKNALGKRGRQ